MPNTSNAATQYRTPPTIFHLLMDIRPAFEDKTMHFTKEIQSKMDIVLLRLLREPFPMENDKLGRKENVAMMFYKKSKAPTNMAAGEGILYFNVLCKPTGQHYTCRCCNDGTNDIELLSTETWSAEYMQSRGVSCKT